MWLYGGTLSLGSGRGQGEGPQGQVVEDGCAHAAVEGEPVATEGHGYNFGTDGMPRLVSGAGAGR